MLKVITIIIGIAGVNGKDQKVAHPVAYVRWNLLPDKKNNKLPTQTGEKNII